MEGPSVADRWDGHQLVLASHRAVPAAVAAWTRRGLDRHEKIVYVASAGHGGLEQLVAELASDGTDAREAACIGQLQAVAADRFFCPRGYEGLVDDAARAGFRGARTLGGPGAAPEPLGADELDRFEQRVERMWRDRGVSALCHYPAGATAGHPDALHGACALHSSGWAEAQIHAHLPWPGRLELDGDVDAANQVVVAHVLDAAIKRAAAAGGDLVVDCGRLRFASVGGWRVIAAAAGEASEVGVRLRLAGVSEVGERVLGFLAVDRELRVGNLIDGPDPDRAVDSLPRVH